LLLLLNLLLRRYTNRAHSGEMVRQEGGNGRRRLSFNLFNSFYHKNEGVAELIADLQVVGLVIAAITAVKDLNCVKILISW